MAFIALGAVAAGSLGAQEEGITSLSCPVTIDVRETVTPLTGWQASPANATHTFERLSIYNGRSGGKEFELAPDDEKKQGGQITQTWRLAGYRDMNIFVRCRYRGTELVLSRDVPKRFDICVFTFDTNNVGKIKGHPTFSCH